MQVTVSSTTDTPEAVIAAQGNLAQAKEVETPAPEEVVEAAAKSDDAEVDTDLATDDDAADEDAPKEGEDAAPKKKKKGGYERRADKATARAVKAEQEVAYWREVALKGKPQEQKPEPLVAKAADGKPNADDFATLDLYDDAVADWRVEQKLAARDAKAKEAEVRASVRAQDDDFARRRDAFAQTKDDWDDRVENIVGIPFSLTLDHIFKTSDMGPELFYELTGNPEEFRRISSLPAITAAREVGKIEARLSSVSQESTETKTTKAPKPITPLSAKGGGAASKSPDNMDFDEYKAWRKKNPRG